MNSVGGEGVTSQEFKEGEGAHIVGAKIGGKREAESVCELRRRGVNR